jgi:hypothetical protein
VDPGALTRQVMDPDLHNKTAADSLDARHETTDQKVATAPTMNFISVLSRSLQTTGKHRAGLHARLQPWRTKTAVNGKVARLKAGLFFPDSGYAQ